MKVLLSALIISLVLISCEKKENIIDDQNEYDYVTGLNGEFTIELESNPSTGYSWYWINKSGTAVVDSVHYDFIPDTPVLIGSGGKELWTFKGIQKGIGIIKLQYVRIWENRPALISKEFTVSVE